MAIQMPKLALPALERKSALMIVGGVVVLGAAGWFGYQNMTAEPPPPAPNPVAMKAPPKPAPKPAAAPIAAPAAMPKEAAKSAVPPPAAQVAAAEMKAKMKEEPKPAMKTAMAMSAPRTHTRALEDARECLKQPTDALIAHCAEQYR